MIALDWIEIPAGEFLMGLSQDQVDYFRFRMSQEKHDPLTRQIKRWSKKYLGMNDQSLIPDFWLQYEVPQKSVYLDTFYISRFPITEG